MTTGQPGTSSECFADDLLKGADEIAFYLFKDRTRRRQVYHLAATTRFPVFRLGTMLCARRSVIMKWIIDQEEGAGRARH